jgi:hypothetical protein
VRRAATITSVMRRGLALLVLLAALVAAPTAHAQSWASRQIETVVANGLMGPSVADFRPTAALTRAELGQALATLTGKPQVVVDPNRAVTVTQLHAALVRYVGLRPAARRIRGTVKLAGLRPPRRLGNEVVARLLRLRYNHAAAHDDRELRPADPITRAEAAHSLARVLDLGQWERDYINRLAAELRLPTLTAWQDRVLTRAVRFVGFPYVWGGTWEYPHTPFSVPTRGGFDCSGYVWRIYKLGPYSGGGSLSSVLQGRTTYLMSGEVPRSQRIPFDRLKPADVVFFGDRGPNSRPSEVGHMGLYLGRGWFVHSSGQGVTLLPLSGWYAERFAWARRPLREAGLS